MNKDNAKDFLPLVQALAEGKTIEYYDKENKEWQELDEILFHSCKEYRIKPEPREFYLWATFSGEDIRSVTKVDMSDTDGWHKIRVREIV